MAEPFLGEIRAFAFGYVPRNWARCNGALLPINRNQALYSIIGITYGGDGQMNFALPNLNGRAPVHVGNNVNLGNMGGEATHHLTINEIPSHDHMIKASASDANKSTVDGNSWAKLTAGDSYSTSVPNTTLHLDSIAKTGANTAHNNMQPYLALQYCIAISGIYPSKN